MDNELHSTDPDSRPRPVVRLKPKADARRLRFGFPLVYDSDLVTDRRTKALKPGTLARLEDAGRANLGLAAVTPGSKIIARILDRNPEAEIDRAWFEARLSRALALRQTLYDQPFYRLVHAEADGLPGIVIDRFGAAAVLQPNAAWAEMHLDALVEALIAVTGVETVVKNASGRARSLEGLDSEGAVFGKGLTGPVPVAMNGATYMADLIGGQKTGLFFDQRDNHAFAADLAHGAKMLDVFSHVGGFGLAGLAAGATLVTAIDSSKDALALAEAGAARMGVSERFETFKSDAFDAMTKLAEENATYDLVVCDPPAFAPQKAALEAGLRAYEKTARLGARLTAPGGYLVLCSCSHAADLEKFRNASLRGVGRAGRVAQVIRTGFASPDHPQHAQLTESGYLKALFLRLDG